MAMPIEKTSYRQIALLSLYGLSFNLSALYGTSEAVVFPLLGANYDAVLTARIANLAGFALAMALCGIAGERLKDVAHSRASYAALGAVGALAMVATAVSGAGVGPLPLLWAGALGRGLFYGAFTMCWIDELMQLEEHLIGVAVSTVLAVYALSGLVVFGASVLSPILAGVLLTLYPVLCVLGLASAVSHSETRRPVAQESAIAPIRTRCLLYAANFTFGVVIGIPLSYFARSSAPPAIVAFAVMAIALLVVFVIGAERVGANMIFRGVMLVYVVAITALLLLGLLDSAAGIVAITALAPVVLYSITIFADTQARLRKPYWRVPGMCQVFAAAGMAMGWAGCYAIYPDGKMPEVQVMLCMCLCMIFITGVFAPNSRSRVRPWGFSSLIPAETAEEFTRRRCSELAGEHGLTSREHEILQLMAAGRVRDDIAEALVISPATVKTHIRNIYSKLGVHSQAELLERIKDA